MLLSYVSILIISILLFGLVSFETSRALKYETNRTNAALLKQVQQAMDRQMQDIESLGRQIAWNKGVEGLLFARTPLQDYKNYSILQIIKDFMVYQTANGFVDNFYVYFKNLDSGISPSGRIDPRILYELYHTRDNISYKEWQKMVRGTYLGDYIPLGAKNDKNKVANSVLYVKSLPIEDPKASAATIIIKLNIGRLQEAIKNIKWVNQGVILVINKDNTLITSTQPDFIKQPLIYEKIAETQNEVSYEVINGERVLVSCISSQITDWKYITIIPDKVLMEKVQYIKRFTMLTVLLWFLVGGIAAFLYARKNYMPISMLVKTLVSKTGISEGEIKNEYSFIQETITNTINEKDRNAEMIEQQKKVLRESYLARLLKGKIESNLSIYDAFSSYDFKLYSDQFALMLFYIESCSGFSADAGEEDKAKELKLVQFSIGSVIEELMAQEHMNYMIEIDEMLACLVNFNQDGQDDEVNERKLFEIASEAMEIVRKKMKILFTVSISGIHRDAAGITRAYQETLEAMEYRMVMENKKIIRYKDIRTQIRNYSYSLETEMQLVNFVKYGDYEKAVKLLEEVFRYNFSNESLPIHMAKCLLFDLVSTLIKAVDEIGMSWDNVFQDKHDPVKELVNCDTVAEMKKQMTGILQKVCGYVLKRKKNTGSKIRDGVVAFVDKHYSDSNLSISMIAEELNMSPKYLASVFRDQTGELLLDYISRFRVEKAKKLLKKGDLNITGIAKTVGFYNSNAFIRVFKKHEGITPGQYGTQTG